MWQGRSASSAQSACSLASQGSQGPAARPPGKDPRAGDGRPPSDSLRREDHRGCQQLLPRGANGDQLARYVAAANMTAKETVDVSSSSSGSRPWTPAASSAGGGPGGRPTRVYGTDQRRAQGRAALALRPVPLRQERVRSQGGGGRRPGWPRIAARSGRSCSWPWPPAATASPSSTWHGDAGPDRCLSGRAAGGPQEGDVRGIAGAAALRPTGYRWCMEWSRCAAGSRHSEEARC